MDDSSDIGNQADMQWHSLDLVLLKFSTGEYHPLARRPRIHIQRSTEVEPRVSARIVGDNLALIVHSYYGTFSDKLIIFDWKIGRRLLQHEASKNAYFSLDFVSPELLFVPNSVLSHFEVWHIPPNQLNGKPPIQILSLQIPAVSPQYSIFNLGCYGEPNPFLHSMPYLPPRPFFSSPESSIIMVTLRMSSNLRLGGRRASYNIFMHRCALLDTIQKWTSPSLLEQQEYLLRSLTNEVTVGFDDATSKVLSTNSILHKLVYISMYLPQSPLGKVGSPHLLMVRKPNPRDSRKSMVSVADFNQHNFRRNAEMMAQLRGREGENNGNNEEGKEEEEKENFEVLDHGGVFSEEVYMGLKCVVYRAPDNYDFDIVLMGEQRLLGLKFNLEGFFESVKVLYIG
ncbi:hypothetical protein M378DRAFT_12420 [Amanita muscaria Koide BX008]|uniref:Uncharacterized protein n=1 Tax=Amanita muscaria (strain Koide BX008) TaxID=946122 RepID=A0A0C2X1M9_AMAMK|nr:hypothetical protein M378DRAFT_12420 [Amanita muscaria Koide BX008]